MAKLTRTQIDQHMKREGQMPISSFVQKMQLLLGNKPEAMADLRAWEADPGDHIKFARVVTHLNLEKAHKNGSMTRILGAWAALCMDLIRR